jgi:hypothetical protein
MTQHDAPNRRRSRGIAIVGDRFVRQRQTGPKERQPPCQFGVEPRLTAPPVLRDLSRPSEAEGRDDRALGTVGEGHGGGTGHRGHRVSPFICIVNGQDPEMMKS